MRERLWLRTMAIADAQAAGAHADAPADERIGALARYAGALARAGVDVVQLRDRDMPDGLLRQCAAAMVGATRESPTRVVVNERAHVAAVSRADGVHLRADGMPAGRVRRTVGATAVVGRSTHAADSRSDEDGLDYVVFGTVFASGSKAPGHPVAGLDALEDECRSRACPVLAVGGITADRCPAVAARGAVGVAAIGSFAVAWRRGQAALDDLVAAMHAAFPATEAGR